VKVKIIVDGERKIMETRTKIEAIERNKEK
jgi:hypothetical protein